MPTVIVPSGSVSDEVARIFSGLFVWLVAPVLVVLIAVGIVDETMRPGIFFFVPALVFVLWRSLPDWLSVKPPGKYADYAYTLTALVSLGLLASVLTLMLLETPRLALALVILAVILAAGRVFVGFRSRAEQKALDVYDARRTPYARGGGQHVVDADRSRPARSPASR